jgi:esterase/lipase superfamily enzyme
MSRSRLLVVIVVTALLGGYAAMSQSQAEPEHAVVRTFFATDRNATGKTKPDEMFGNGRSSLSYGTADVNIPRRVGELESPSKLKSESRDDPSNKHVVLLSTAISSKDTFFAELAARTRGSPRSRAILFVHGYNVTFEDAARRTAQISYELGFEGAPAFYSWPSQGTYTVDEENVEWAQANLRGFLEDFFTRSDAQNIYLIADGMGNRALTRAVASLLLDKPALRDQLAEVILMAPDIDAEVFKRNIAPALAASGRPITLYASSDDLALAASKKVHGYARAGDSGQGLVVVSGIETVVAEARSVLSDMFDLIRNGQRADQRFGLRPIVSKDGRYWEFDNQKGQAPQPEYAVVRTFFATDRNVTGKTKPDEMFGNDRSILTYGTCNVSIPREHRMGELESPSIFRLQFRQDPSKHVVLLSTAISEKGKFFAELADRVRAVSKRTAFLFVHGYNVTFEDAARRTAQISYDLGFEGAPTFYSWPSQGTATAYTVDEQNVEWAQANLRGFLEDFFTRSDAQNVYLIAHSMGNRALTRAVASLLADKPAVRDRLTEVILTAPDIDAGVFKRDIAPALAASGRPITLYASSNDLALAASKKVHGYPRAGDSGQGLVVVSGIETVDATAVDTSLLGHSFFAEARSVLSDMFYLIRNGQRADQRFGLRPIVSKDGRHWEFKK